MQTTVPSSEKFAPSRSIKAQGTRIQLQGRLPGEHVAKGDNANEIVTAKDRQHERTIKLGKKLAEGGEGAVYSTSLKGHVAKVYKRDKLTTDRRDKLQIMISKPINWDNTGICFPEALILNEQNEFVGYLMREAKGYELGKSVFQPMLFLEKFPGWKKRDTINLALAILQRIRYLNARNVILGDINPANILVVSPDEVYFVDCDSYQVEGYPCPVGTANFTPPEAQGRDYKAFLRTQAMEDFAIATLMFMIMLPGKAPYSAVGGASPEQNIKNGVFPYPLTEDTDKTPPGKWGFMWSHLSYKTKEAFFNTFAREGRYFSPSKRLDADGWVDVFEKYRYSLKQMVKNDPMADDIFPDRLKNDYVVEYRTCNSCGKKFPITKKRQLWEQRKSEEAGSIVHIDVCDECKAKPRQTRSYNRASSYNSARNYSGAASRNKNNSKPASSRTVSSSSRRTNSVNSKVVGYGSSHSRQQKRPSHPNANTTNKPGNTMWRKILLAMVWFFIGLLVGYFIGGIAATIILDPFNPTTGSGLYVVDIAANITALISGVCAAAVSWKNHE